MRVKEMYAPARSPVLRLVMRPLWPVKESLGRLSDFELAPRPAQSQSLTASGCSRSVAPAVLQGRKCPRHRWHVYRPVTPTAPRAGDGRPVAGQRSNARRSGSTRPRPSACIMENSVPESSRRGCRRLREACAPSGGAQLTMVPLWPNYGRMFPVASLQVVASRSHVSPSGGRRRFRIRTLA